MSEEQLTFDSVHDPGDMRVCLKTYIQPFERYLAADELESLLQGSNGQALFSNEAPNHVNIGDSDAIDSLLDRLAYWERITTWQDNPTLQVRLEAGQADSRLNTSFVYHRTRRLRYGPHGIHEYRGKFFPQLVKSLVNIAALQPGDIVLDPMCGSGTTNCEARSMGMKTLGLDMNPLSLKITQAKIDTLDVKPGTLKKKTNEVIDALRSHSVTEDRTDTISHADKTYLLRWFDPVALSEVLGALCTIRRLSRGRLRNVFEVCLSNIVRSVSWQKDSDLRVRKHVTDYSPGEVTEAVINEIARTSEKLYAYRTNFPRTFRPPSSELRLGDIKSIADIFPEFVGACDLLITSPPYAMALPYIDTDRLSLSVLDLLNRSGQRVTEKELIGNREVSERERRQLWDAYTQRKSELPRSIRTLISAIAKHNHGDGVGFRRRNLPALLGKYFLDMRDAMLSSLAMMKSGSYAFFVVGNNSTYVNGDRLEIETDKLLWELGKHVGWQQCHFLDMELLPSRDIFRENRGTAESILCFKA